MIQKPRHEKLEQRVHVPSERIEVQGNFEDTEERYRTILESIEEAYFETDLKGKFTFFNNSLPVILGYSRDELLKMTNQDFMPFETASEIFHLFADIFRTGKPIRKYGYEVIKKDGTRGFHELFASLIRDRNGKPIGFRGIAHDITARKLAENEQEELINQLQTALAEVKTLKGIFPICASCKQIRDDKGYWNQIENYIRDHSDAEFSHSICPDCAKKLYPDLDIYGEDR